MGMAPTMLTDLCGGERRCKQIVKLPTSDGELPARKNKQQQQKKNDDGKTAATGVVKFVEAALERGVNFLDVTGAMEAEGLGELVRKRRGDVVLAVRFGEKRADDGKVVADASRAHVREVCQQAIAKLGVDSIDFFYQSLADTTTPVEETAAELKSLVDSGLVKYVGMAGTDASSLLKAHSIQPVTGVTVNWSVWSHAANTELLQVCNELGVTVVANKPLVGGVLATKCFDSKAVGEKVKDLLDKHRVKLVEKLKQIRGKPSRVLAERIKATAQIQFGNLSKKIVELLNKQERNFVAQVEAAMGGEKPMLLTNVKKLSGEQKEHMIESLTKLINQQLGRLKGRVEKLVDKPHAQVLLRLEKACACQKGILLKRLLDLHGKKVQVLTNKLRNRLGAGSAVVVKVEKILARQHARLVDKISSIKDKQAEKLTCKADKVHEKQMTAATARVHTVLERQGKQISSKIQNVLGKRKAVAPGMDAKLKRQREALETRVKKMFERGATAERIDMIVGKVMEKHAHQSMSAAERITERRATKMAERVTKSMSVSEQPVEAILEGDVLDDNPKGSGLEGVVNKVEGEDRVKKMLFLSKRMKELARGHNTKLKTIALAWLRAQGNHIMPVVQFGGGEHFLDDLVKSANLNLTEEEIASLKDGGVGKMSAKDQETKEGWAMI